MSDSDLLLLEMKRNLLIHLLQHFSLPIQNLHTSISADGLGNRTKAATATIDGALGDSYPPSHGLLDSAYHSLKASIISFLVTNRSLYITRKHLPVLQLFQKHADSSDPSVVV
ncbi:hypothetical protein OIU74_002569 [Salix koriyanagi]|uniref:Uncharacterized protein n=1 Tax=Salix koriyanagi TaxID=2511006 RepID=A0A9Q1APG1_9ROSI|nr:hypothetical protein OIU74_002569 [Salix koriyanagi]